MMLCVAGAALAEPSIGKPAERRAPDDLFDLRLRYGVAWHAGSQQDTGPGMSYVGLTPNDLAFTGWVWPLLDGGLGFVAHVEREGFGLFDGGTLVTRVAVIRAHAGVAGRLRLGVFRLEPVAAYAFDQLPAFTSSLSPASSPQGRHSVLVAMRGVLDFGRVAIEPRVDGNLTLPVGGLPTAISGLSASLAVRVELVRTGTVVWGAVASAAYGTDGFVRRDVTARQSIIRGGVSLDVQWKEELPPEAPPVGVLRLAVLSADDGTPLPKATLKIESAGGPLSVALGPDGLGTAKDVVPGAVVASASLEGYLPAEERASLAAGVETSLVLKLKKEAPKVGNVAFTVTDKANNAPIAKASVTVGDKTVTTDDAGKATIDALPLGPASIDVTADTFQPGTEAATVVGGVTSNVAIQLLSAKKRTMATITGMVRSAQGGAPVAANLAIPEAKIKTRANAKGEFTFRVIGGTYTVNLSARGYLSQTKSVTVQDGEQAIFNVDLSPR